MLMLSADEIRAVVAAVRDGRRASASSTSSSSSPSPLRFVAVTRKEDEGTEHGARSRAADVLTLDPSTGLATEHVVSLSVAAGDGKKIAAQIVSSVTLPAGVQPMLTPDDCDLAEQIVQQSPEVAELLKKRCGSETLDVAKHIACDPWSVHFACDEERTKLLNWRKANGDDDSGNIPARLVQTFLYQRQLGDGLEDNHYAHPIDILPVVDLNARKVVHVDGIDENADDSSTKLRLPIPTQSVNYHRDLLSTNSYLQSTWRHDTLKALNVVQPDGPSFRVSSENVVDWQKWSIQVDFNYREGLVLKDVSFDGRPVLKRASLVEMAVPYGDPHPPYTRKCAFDTGDYGLGYCANSLELGCDCLGRIHYFDATLVDCDGNPVVKPKVVCMHEEDNGLLWKHVEYRNGHNESRRSRELVLSFIATVVNYEYLFYWRFKQDGMIDYEIKLSGELSTNLPSVALGEDPDKPSHGVLVAPSVNAQIHQHMFCARLVMDVDGTDNLVSEVDVVREPLDPKTNPYGNSFCAVETVLEKELDAIRTIDPTKARTWKVSSTTKKNRVNGKPTAYKLIPFTKGPAQPVLMVDPTCAVSKKGTFATANLWVTPFHEKERFPAGEYVLQADSSRSDTVNGLPDWTAQNRSLIDGSGPKVLWHAFGVCHVPRAEDFPVMPCEVTGFSLKPDNFFEGNPAIDLLPEINKASALTDNSPSSECCG